MANKTNQWEMNDTQKAFVEILKERGAVTLFELKLDGIEFKTGSINVLKSKGIVVTDEEKREFECDIVYNGEKVGTIKKSATVYRLAK